MRALHMTIYGEYIHFQGKGDNSVNLVFSRSEKGFTLQEKTTRYSIGKKFICKVKRLNVKQRRSKYEPSHL